MVLKASTEPLVEGVRPTEVLVREVSGDGLFGPARPGKWEDERGVPLNDPYTLLPWGVDEGDYEWSRVPVVFPDGRQCHLGCYAILRMASDVPYRGTGIPPGMYEEFMCRKAGIEGGE